MKLSKIVRRFFFRRRNIDEAPDSAALGGASRMPQIDIDETSTAIETSVWKAFDQAQANTERAQPPIAASTATKTDAVVPEQPSQINQESPASNAKLEDEGSQTSNQATGLAVDEKQAKQAEEKSTYGGELSKKLDALNVASENDEEAVEDEEEDADEKKESCPVDFNITLQSHRTTSGLSVPASSAAFFDNQDEDFADSDKHEMSIQKTRSLMDPIPRKAFEHIIRASKSMVEVVQLNQIPAVDEEDDDTADLEQSNKDGKMAAGDDSIEKRLGFSTLAGTPGLDLLVRASLSMLDYAAGEKIIEPPFMARAGGEAKCRDDTKDKAAENEISPAVSTSDEVEKPEETKDENAEAFEVENEVEETKASEVATEEDEKEDSSSSSDVPEAQAIVSSRSMMILRSSRSPVVNFFLRAKTMTDCPDYKSDEDIIVADEEKQPDEAQEKEEEKEEEEEEEEQSGQADADDSAGSTELSSLPSKGELSLNLSKDELAIEPSGSCESAEQQSRSSLSLKLSKSKSSLISSVRRSQSNLSIKPTRSNLSIKPTKSNLSINPSKSNLSIKPIKSNLSIKPIKSNLSVKPSKSNISIKPSKSNISIKPSLSNMEADT